MFLDWYFINIGQFFYQVLPHPPYFHIGDNDTKS